MNTEPAPDLMPDDLPAVAADDALLDQLGSGQGAPDGADGAPALVLSAWRSDVHADPIRQLVDTDTALAVASAARRRAVHAAALTALAVVFAVLGLVSYGSGPGDLLYPLRELLPYGEAR